MAIIQVRGGAGGGGGFGGGGFGFGGGLGGHRAVVPRGVPRTVLVPTAPPNRKELKESIEQQHDKATSNKRNIADDAILFYLLAFIILVIAIIKTVTDMRKGL